MENVVEVSENLAQIVSNVTLNNTVDIAAVTSVVTKIINSLNGTQRTENKVNIFSYSISILVLIIFVGLKKPKLKMCSYR